VFPQPATLCHVNLTLRSILTSFYLRSCLPSGLFPSGVSTKVLYAFLIFLRATCSACLILHELITLIRWTVQIMKPLIPQFSPASRHFISLGYNCSPQRPVAEHRQSVTCLCVIRFVPHVTPKQIVGIKPLPLPRAALEQLEPPIPTWNVSGLNLGPNTYCPYRLFVVFFSASPIKRAGLPKRPGYGPVASSSEHFWIFLFHKRRIISWLAKLLSASQCLGYGVWRCSASSPEHVNNFPFSDAAG
jgi:hypothetical protein